jgi:hypothetical protein
MPNKILAEHEASSVMTITLASLADAGVRQSTMIDNTDNAQMVRVFFKVTTGTTPTDNKTIEFYLLSGDDPASSNIRTDNAGASDAGITLVTAPLVFAIPTDNTSDKAYYGSFLIRNPGIEWGIAVKNNTGVVLNSTGGNHELRYVPENQEVQ